MWRIISFKHTRGQPKDFLFHSFKNLRVTRSRWIPNSILSINPFVFKAYIYFYRFDLGIT
jgi:hypothetical protein